jgi:hypothetical protein
MPLPTTRNLVLMSEGTGGGPIEGELGYPSTERRASRM